MRRILFAAALLVPSLAFARARLVTSTPPNGGTLAAGAQTVRLTFDRRLEYTGSRLTLEGTAAEARLPLLPDSRPDALAAQVELTPGSYRLHWEALADGQRTSGNVRFTVTTR